MNRYVVFDTPGQIEVFTWSASGAIITEALASRYPTVIVYVMDTVRSNNPITFMSNMLYACSVLYKYKLPLIIALNKSDVIDYKFAIDWMKDWESFQTAIDKETSYMANLTRSMALALDSFYENISAIGVSAVTGLGLDQLLIAIKEAAVEYERDYRPEYERIKKETERERIRQREQQLKNAVKQSGDGNKVELMTFGDPTDDFFRDNNEDSDEDMITGKDDDQEEGIKPLIY
jgi:translation initiation factor IF-2